MKKISERSISALAKIVTGDTQISPYRSGPVLVRLFNNFGANDVYGQGFPSRWAFAEDKIRSINGTDLLNGLIREILDPRDWLDYGKQREDAVTYLNDYLKHDGFEISKDADFYSLHPLSGGAVAFKFPSDASLKVNQLFIDQQIKKCDGKLADGDFDGAITNARSLLEAVLTDVEQDLSEESPPQYDGDLIKLYKRVARLLHLEPDRADIEEPLKQVLGGLSSVITGLSALRNKMGDAHVRSYQPAKRHALLVVNAAKTAAGFILDCKEERLRKGKSN
jgi:hypothetical protein